MMEFPEYFTQEELLQQFGDRYQFRQQIRDERHENQDIGADLGSTDDPSGNRLPTL